MTVMAEKSTAKPKPISEFTFAEQQALAAGSDLLRQAMREHTPPLTPVTLGEKMGVTRQAVLRMLNGQNMQLSTLAKYMEACGKTLVLTSIEDI